MGEIDIQKVLIYYAVINLGITAASFIFLFLARKSPRLLKRYNELLDSLFEKNGAEKSKTDENKGDQDGETTEKDDKESKALQDGITMFSLSIGDTYHCRLNSLEKGDGLKKYKWFTENEFVGRIKDENVFEALREGTVKVFNAYEDNINDEGATIYEIKVKAHDENWFAASILKAVVEKKYKAAVLPGLLGRKIIMEDRTNDALTFEGLGNEKKIIVQTGKDGSVRRVLYIMNANTETEREIIDGLNERMSEIRTEGHVRIWAHQFIDEDKNEVDAYAYMKYSSEGNIHFGIGQAWRENGDIDEFLDNIVMAERMFSELAPEEPVTEVTAVKEKKDKPAVITKEGEKSNGNESVDGQSISGEPEDENQGKTLEEEPESEKEQHLSETATSAEPQEGETVDFDEADKRGLEDYEDYSED